MESCSKTYFPSKAKSRITSGGPCGLFPRSRVAPAPFRGWRKAGGRRALGWSEVTATLAARRGIFLQRRHGASGGASSCACGKRPLTRILTWHLARWLAAAGTNGGASSPLRGAPAAWADSATRKAGPECLRRPGEMGSAGGGTEGLGAPAAAKVPRIIPSRGL